MERYAQRIEAIDMNVVKDPEIDPGISGLLLSLDLPEFGPTYLSLASLFARLPTLDSHSNYVCYAIYPNDQARGSK